MREHASRIAFSRARRAIESCGEAMEPGEGTSCVGKSSESKRWGMESVVAMRLAIEAARLEVEAAVVEARMEDERGEWGEEGWEMVRAKSVARAGECKRVDCGMGSADVGARDASWGDAEVCESKWAEVVEEIGLQCTNRLTCGLESCTSCVR